MKWVTCEQMRALDRRGIEGFGIPGVVLMENAGRETAREAAALYRERGCSGPVLIFCGTGNNGGDGFVIARHLSNAGLAVEILIVGDAERIDRGREAGINLTVCERMALPIATISSMADVPEARARLRPGALVVDAIFGIGLSKPPREPQASVIRAIAEAGLPTLAVDVPSGLDADTGQPLEVAVRADVTATMACPKIGFRGPGEEYVGKLVVIDIGLPASLLTFQCDPLKRFP